MSKFADDTKLCHRARNPDDIMELQEDINKLVEWAKKWQMSSNVDKCSVMHIGHNNVQSNYDMSNQQLPTTDQQRDLGIIFTKDLKSLVKTFTRDLNKQRKAAKRPAEYWDSLPVISSRRQRVFINQSYSNWAPVTSGVQQSSVLGSRY